MSQEKHFRVTLVRGTSGAMARQRATLIGLGLKRRGQSVALQDTMAVRGMIVKVVHMVAVEPVAGAVPPARRARRRRADAAGSA